MQSPHAETFTRKLTLPQPPEAFNTGQAHLLMSPPDHYTVDYKINPWMRPGTARNDAAVKQWEALYQALSKDAGVKIHLVPPALGNPDMVFTANAGFVYGQKAIVSRFLHPERQGEEPHFKKWFEENGFDTSTLADDLYFEGAGDALIWPSDNGPVVFAGYGIRSVNDSAKAITERTGLEVISLRLMDDRFYHVDVCTCPFEDGHFLYYPGAIDEAGNAAIERIIPADKRIPVTEEEALHFTCNMVQVGNTVITPKTTNRIVDVLTEKGFNVHQLDLSEFLKAGGAAKCLTLRIA